MKQLKQQIYELKKGRNQHLLYFFMLGPPGFQVQGQSEVSMKRVKCEAIGKGGTMAKWKSHLCLKRYGLLGLNQLSIEG